MSASSTRWPCPPCHCCSSSTSTNRSPHEPGLSCQLYQRSADLFLGVPFNIASYALLTLMVAQVCGYEPREFVHTFGDLHLYANHLDQARLQLTREPRPLPTMSINPDVQDIDAFTFDDFQLEGLRPPPPHQGRRLGVTPGARQNQPDHFCAILRCFCHLRLGHPDPISYLLTSASPLAFGNANAART